ncbi:MAG: hypothetical protein PHG73_03600 [Pygmaiobacter sp.]|jgi:hypothetical protein|nr:hypothetical protein [Pygmaiobacter sp.]
MLGKLLKYELRATGRQVLPLCGGMVAFALLRRLLGLLQITRAWPGLNEALDSLGIGLFTLLLIACTAAVFIVLIVRYYRNLYTDEGYLMNTLPVSPTQNLLSKMFAAVIWQAVSVLALLLSVFISVIDTHVWRQIVFGFAQMNLSFQHFLLLQQGLVPLITIEIILLVIIGAFADMLKFYAAISLGQFIRRHRVLGAVVFYFGLNFAFSVLSTLIMLPLGLMGNDITSMAALPQVLALSFGITLLLTILEGVVCFLLARWCLAKKLELE